MHCPVHGLLVSCAGQGIFRRLDESRGHLSVADPVKLPHLFPGGRQDHDHAQQQAAQDDQSAVPKISSVSPCRRRHQEHHRRHHEPPGKLDVVRQLVCHLGHARPGEPGGAHQQADDARPQTRQGFPVPLLLPAGSRRHEQQHAAKQGRKSGLRGNVRQGFVQQVHRQVPDPP